MKNIENQDSEVLSLATALSKRKTSDPIQIVWEDGVPFKMRRDYLVQFYAEQFAISNLRSAITLHINGMPPHFELRDSTQQDVVQIKVQKEGLQVNCTCGQMVTGLCYHEVSFLYHQIPENNATYFKGLCPKFLDDLKPWQINMLNFKIGKWYNMVELQLLNHPTFGRMINLQPSYFDDEREINMAHLSFTKDMPRSGYVEVKFFVPLNSLSFGVPVFLPFKSKSRDSYGKCYLFTEEEIMLSSKDTYLETFSHRIARIFKDYKKFKEENKDQIKEVNRYDRNKNQMLQIWRDLLTAPLFPMAFNFVSTYRSYRFPYQINLSNSYEPICAQMTLAGSQIVLKAHFYDEDLYQKLVLEVYYQGIRIENPTFLSSENSYFLQLENKEVIFIDDFEIEYLLRRFRKFDFIVTALPDAFNDFLKQFVIPLSQFCAIEIHSKKAETRNLTLDDLRCSRVLHISETDGFIHLSASMEYGELATVPLQADANIMIYEQGKDFAYFYRDKIMESSFRDFIVKQHPSFESSTAHSNWFIPTQTLHRKAWLHDFIDACEEEGIKIVLNGLNLGCSYFPHTLECTVRNIHFEDNKCAILLHPQFGNTSISISQFEELIIAGRHVFLLEDDTYGMIRKKDSAIYKPLFLSSTGDEDLVVLNTVQLISLQPILEQLDPRIIQDSIRERREKLANMEEIPLLPIPSTIQATLRPYQQVGFSWMAFLNEFGWGGLLADDMGLGKTIQVITLLEYYYQENPNGAPALIVLPNTLLFNWQQEYQKFAPNRLVCVYHGKSRFPVAALSAGTVMLTTYGTMMTDVEEFETMSFSYLIMDESQAVKNRNSKRFECLSQVKATYRIAMTGTPIENGIQDIYSQMTLVNPGFFGNYRNFNKNYKGGKDDEHARETVGSLQSVIQPFILRRTKKQVALDLPEKTETLLYMDMLPDQRKIYEKYRKIFKGELKSNLQGKDASKSKFLAIEALSKLRQICNSPSLVKGEVLPESSVKLNYIDEILDEVVPGHKVLLFSFYTSMLQLVAKRIAERGVSYAYLDGKLKQEDRQRAVEKFQHEDDCRVFLISLKAGGTGLNLTAADYVYILDPWWNPAAEAQAIDRCYRIGQDKHVMAYKIVCKDTVEERILALQADKKRMADGLILDEMNLMKSLGKDELLRLFE